MQKKVTGLPLLNHLFKFWGRFAYALSIMTPWIGFDFHLDMGYAREGKNDDERAVPRVAIMEISADSESPGRNS